MSLLPRLRSLLPACVVTALAVVSAGGQINWLNTATSADWATGSNWSGGNPPDTLTEVAQFQYSSYAFQPTLNAAIQLNGLNVTSNSTAVTISNGGAGAITLNGGLTSGRGVLIASRSSANPLTVHVPITLNNSHYWRQEDNDTATFTGNLTLGSNTLTLESSGSHGPLALLGNISGTGSLSKKNPNLVILGGNNSFSGATNVDGGTLRLDSAGALSPASNLKLNGGQVELGLDGLTLNLGTGAGQIQFSGHGGFGAVGANRTVALSGNATVTIGSGNFLANEKVLLLGAATSDATVIFTNPINLNGRTGLFAAMNGAAEVDGVLAGPISGNWTSGLRISGQTPSLSATGVLRLDSPNTFGGSVSVDNGTLVANAPGAIPGHAYVGSNTWDQNGGPIFGTLEAAVPDAIGGRVTVFGGSTVKARFLSSWQIELLPAGAAQYDLPSDVPPEGLVQPNFAGAVLAAGYPADQAFLDAVDPAFEGVLGLAADSAQALDLSPAGADLPQVRLAAWTNPATFQGSLVPAADTYRFGGGNALLTVQTALDDGAGSRGLEIAPSAHPLLATGLNTFNYRPLTLPSRVTFTAANLLTGAVTVGPYQVATLSGPAGAFASASAIHLTGGQLAVYDAAGSSNANRLPDVGPIEFHKASTLTFNGTGSSTENVGPVRLQAGHSYLRINRATGSGNYVVQADRLERQRGASVQFNQSNSRLLFDTAPTVQSLNTLGGWATYNEDSWATWTAANGFGSLGTFETSTTDSNWADTEAVSLGASATLTANRTIHLLRNVTGAVTLNLGTNRLVINGGGLLATNNTFTLNGGSLTAGNAGVDYELFVGGGNGRNLTINSTITDNEGNPVSLVRLNNANYNNGDFTLTLALANSYSGGTFLNWGKTRVGHGSALGTGPVTAVGYAQVDFNNWNNFPRRTEIEFASGNFTYGNAFRVQADLTLTSSGSVNTTLTGAIELSDGAHLSILGAGSGLHLQGPISGQGSLRHNTGPLFLDGTLGNSYTGPTLFFGPGGDTRMYLNKTAGQDAIPAGGLILGGYGDGYNRGEYGRETVQYQNHNQINDSAVVTFVGAPDNPATLQLDRYSDVIGGLRGASWAGVVENNSSVADSTLGLNPAAGQWLSFGGQLRNGGGSKSLAVQMTGGGVQELRGVNTYSGGTSVSAGLLLASGPGVISSNRTATRTASSPVLTGLPDTTGLMIGQPVSGGGLNSNSFIVSIDSATQVTLNQNVASAGTGSLTFGAASPLGTGPVAVSGGTLGGPGVLAGALNVQSGGSVSPGASAGTLTALGGITLDGTYHWELAALTDDSIGGQPGVDWDWLGSTIPITYGSNAQLALSFSGLADPDSGDPFWDCHHSWTIASPGAGATPTVAGSFRQGYFTFDPVSGVLSFTATPYFLDCPVAALTANTEPGLATASVTWTAPAAGGGCGASVTVTQTAGLPPGSDFPAGDTTISYLADDGLGNTDTCSFIVRVVDTEDPQVTCPGNLVVGSGGTGSVVVTWTATALDNVDGAIGTVSLPASGSVFSTGTTTVTVSATDTAGNTGQCPFTVTVDDTAPSVIGSGFTAALDALNAAAQNPFRVTVTFDDNHGLDSSSLGDGDVRLTGPGGYDAAGTLVGVSGGGGSGYPGKVGGRRVWAGFAPSGTQRTATYSFTPPGGAWTFEDNGTYTLALQNGAVTDLAGNPVPAGTLGTVAVDIINPPDSLSLDNNVLADGTGPGVTVGYLAASPTDKPVAYTFSLVAGDGDTDNALFSVSGDALATAQTLLAEILGTARLSVRLRVDNGAGGVLEQAFPIYLQVTRLYVAQGAVGSFDSGVSWADALLELSDAFAALQEPWGELVTEIWVAAGTYTPGPAATDTFPLWPQLAVYGGFAGGETDLAQRPDPFGLTTLLDGANRARHVVTAIDAPADAVLDGFTIRRGQATGSGADEMAGGGLFVRGGAPTLRNLVLAENRASKLGGGAYLENTAATLENLTFWSNLSSSSGGGLHALGGSPALRRVSFLSNRASLQGGGLSLQGSPADVRNAVFQDNLAGRYGGGAYVAASAAWFRNCTFAQNRAAARGQAGALLIDRTSATTVRNSVFWDNTAPAYPEVYLLSPRTSRLFYCVVEGGQSYGTGIVTANPLLDPVTLVPAEGSSAIGLGVGVEPLDRAGAPRTRNEAGAFATAPAP